MAERLFILDAHSLIFQVFHAIPEMTSPSGMPTNAVFGFVRDLLFVRNQKKPEYLVCAFDIGEKNFRHDIDAQYKATRSKMPDDLRLQMDLVHRVLAGFRIPVLGQQGFEADDYLASVAVESARRGMHAFLCTADKDMRQVIGPLTTIFDLRRNRLIDRAYVIKDWGVTPEQVIDYQAMVGDSVDNIAGVRGVGPKTARTLLEKYGDLDTILEHIDEIPGKRMKQNFYEGRASALRSRELVKLRTDLPLPESWDDWRIQPPDVPALLSLFEELGFHRFAEDLRSEGPQAEAEAWETKYTPITTQKAFAEFRRTLSQQQRVSVDLETTSVEPMRAEVVGLSFCWQQGEAHYVAVQAPEGETELEAEAVLAELKPYFEDASRAKVGQNLKYDAVVLRRHGIELRGIAFDSMVGSYLLEPGERIHNLDDLSRRLLGHETIKIADLFTGADGKKPKSADIRMETVPVERICDYACEDADVALRLCDQLEPRLRSVGKLGDLWDDLERPVLDVLVSMEHAGIRVDPERLRAISDEFAGRLAEIETAAHELVGEPFNLDSPTQLRRILFEDLGLPASKRTKSGPSTDQEVLEELADAHPLCGLILDHRRFAKLKGTYLDTLPLLIHPETGRIHASFNQTVTATGRLSSSDPNLQNIPVRYEDGQQIRQAFLPGADDQLLLRADYSQIELRLLAFLSEDPALVQAFIDDLDIHAAVAAEIAGVPLDQVTSELRRKAKAVNFGIMYGLSAYGLARRLKIPQDEAQAFIDSYYERYGAIDAFFEQVLEFARANRYVETVLGRRRSIDGVRKAAGRSRNLAERTAINTVIQGSAADLIKRAMVGVARRLDAVTLDARLLLQIHDELVFEVRRDQVDRLAAIVVEEMITALPLGPVPLKVDVGVGPNWLETDPLDVPLRSS